MDGTARAFRLTLVVLAIALARADIPSSHDNILRIQLWDEEGMRREIRATEPTPIKHHKLKVNLDTLFDAMMGDEDHSAERFARHKVRHKRRRPRLSGTDLPWRFHSGSGLRNVAVYDDNVPWELIEASLGSVNASDVSDSSAPVNVEREVSPPMTLRQDEDEEVKKQLPVVPKCCSNGQNLTITYENGKVKSFCSRSTLSFQPIFHKANETHIWNYDSNVFETIVGNPCKFDRYKLEPDKVSEDEFYLLFNGSLFVPFSQPPLLGTLDFCMETFWNESNPAGITLPLVCFQTPIEEAGTTTTLIAYAIGLIISVPFLLATAAVYIFINELRDTHGKALACHSICLAVAFSCLAATQLAGRAFPVAACTIMAYLIQFSFVSCFFWLNVMCFDTYLNVRRYIHSSVSRRSMRRRFAWYCVYAILLPVILLLVTIVMDLSPAVPSTYLKPNFGVKGCWFKTDQAALPYFYGPVAIILLSNLVIFLFTSRAFAKHYDKLKDLSPLDIAHSDFSTSDDWVRLGTVLGQPLSVPERTSSPPRDPQPTQINFSQRLKKYKKIFRTCCLLSVIMGLSWVLEVVSWAAGAGTAAVSVWSIFDLINALQGVVIFAIFVLQQPVRSFIKDEEVKKQLPVVPKCCSNGQNLTITYENGKVKSFCSRSTLSFQPIFHKANETHIWNYDSNVFETIVGNPCKFDRYKLEPDKVSEDEFYLLFNGSLFVPFSQPPLLGTLDFCMETFWNESNPAGITLPLVCFQTPIEEAGTTTTLIAYAIGLIISVPFLLATAAVYIFINELRDTHGKALACHSICLAVAFSCLAATQLAGRAFPVAACTIMAYLIQFSFVSCFFWLNVMCFDTYLNVRRYIHSSVSRRSMRRRFAWYCVYAILLPVILLLVTIVMDLSPAVPSTYLKPNFGVKGCWFKTDQAALPYFYGPVAIILLSNLVIFLFTSRAFAKHYDKLKDLSPLDIAHSDFSTSDDWVRLGTVLGQPLSVPERTSSPPRDPQPTQINFSQRLKKYKKIFRTCCLLSVIMGLSWVLEVVSWAAGAGTAAVSVWSIFDLINALQGVVIFAIFVLQQPVRSFIKDEEVKKQLPVVPKCCSNGQNLTITYENGKVKSFCSRSTLSFQPIFHKANETHIWNYDSNVFETIVGNPCKFDRYKLEPDKVSEDEFYLLFNGSLFVPFSQPPLLGTLDFCMETFWNESNPAGITLPLVCFQTPIEEAGTTTTLIAYAIGLIISVPFLLATAAVYIFINELRDTHGKALACHSICLAVAFSCLAATQLAGRAFPVAACTIMAYLIQFSFVSCFFWLNVMCFDTYLNVRRYIHSSVSRRSMRRRFAWYCVYAILLPVILLLVTIVMDLSPAVPSTYLKPNFGVKGCWFKTDQAALPYFYGPVAIILLSNLVIFLFTSRAFAKHYDKLKDLSPLDIAHSDFSTSDDWVRLGTVLGQPLSVPERTSSPPRDPQPTQINFSQRLKKYKKIFRTCCLLSVIMGLSWVLEVVSWAAGAGTAAVSVWSIFDLINALQGVVIFAIFVLQQPVRSFIKFSKLCKMCRRKRDGSEVSVVSDRNSIDGRGRRDFV